MNNTKFAAKMPNDHLIMKMSDFAAFGVPVVAYVKKIDLDGVPAYSVHGADGQPLSVESSEDLAAMAARHKNLMPVMVQ